jgi:hypothetical protein
MMEINRVDERNAPDYVKSIEAIHGAAYSRDHFTSTSGSKYLERYNALLIETADVALVCLVDRNVVGFLIAGDNVAEGVARFTDANRLWLAARLKGNPVHFWEKSSTSSAARLTALLPPACGIYSCQSRRAQAITARESGRLSCSIWRMISRSVASTNTGCQ